MKAARAGRRKKEEMDATQVQVRCPISGECKLCGRVLMGWIMLNSRAQVVDSDGLIVFPDGIVCSSCLESEVEKKAI
jgi:hypothetical protein